MRTLIMIRHGKSDWKADYSHDHERPLNKRGRRAAKRMGRFLEASGYRPDAILTSSAVRARTTVERAAKAAGWRCPIVVSEELYGNPPGTVIEQIRHQPDSAETLLVAGHQPAWADACSQLIGGGELRYPTAAAACIRFEADCWSRIGSGQGQLIWFVPPKLIRFLDESRGEV